jgi:hypothetical protein
MQNVTTFLGELMGDNPKGSQKATAGGSKSQCVSARRTLKNGALI